MKGFEVLASALSRSADHCYAVPGYPVTELSAMAKAEPVNAEKVALEYALGDSIMGKRAAVIMKNVGLNNGADLLVQATTQGLAGGVVIVAGDDPMAAGSTNAMDSRYFGELAQTPVLEPDPEVCSASVEEAFSVSESFSRIVILRVTPQLVFGEAVATAVPRTPGEGKVADPRLTMKGRVDQADSYLPGMFAWSARSRLNRMKGGVAGVGAAEGDSRIVTVYPPPPGLAGFTRINEIGRPFVAEHLAVVPPAAIPHPQTSESRGFYRTFCRNCPFIPVFDIMKRKGIQAIVDAGCSILALNPPYRIAGASYGLGSAIGVAARSTHVALIGDYALLHSGLQSLIDVYEKRLSLLCIVLENRCMGMTGGQEAPSPCKYIQWADPLAVRASATEQLEELITIPEEPVTLVVQGTCPEGRHHETVEY
ncbi:MAG TPA: thiamine pyrophosphate-dependent enzyme [Methanoregulaceae archaeon]|nr:thiamine pyrophosphate-dependent enzyme [Methanoregulaceae archaeon]